MKQILFPEQYDNESAHRQLKTMMKQRKQLYIQMDGVAYVSTKGVTQLRYELNPLGWQWLLNYLMTGDYEDFGVFPSNVTNVGSEFSQHLLTELIEQGCNIARIPFLRETTAYIKLRALFRFGKLFFSIRKTEQFIDYLNDKGL